MFFQLEQIVLFVIDHVVCYPACPLHTPWLIGCQVLRNEAAALSGDAGSPGAASFEHGANAEGSELDDGYGMMLEALSIPTPSTRDLFVNSWLYQSYIGLA